jgi:signal transduction histidine kinase
MRILIIIYFICRTVSAKTLAASATINGVTVSVDSIIAQPNYTLQFTLPFINSAKLNTSNALAIYLLQGNILYQTDKYDQSIQAYTKAKNIAKQNNLQQVYIYCLDKLGTSCSANTDMEQAIKYYFEEDALLKNTTNYNTIIKVKCKIAEQYRILDRCNDALTALNYCNSYINSTVNEAVKINFYLLLVSVNNQYYTSSKDTNYISNSFIILQQLLANKNIARIKSYNALANAEMGFVYKTKLNYNKAFEHYTIAQNIFYSINDTANAINQSLNKFHLYCDKNMSDKAIAIGENILLNTKADIHFMRRIEIYSRIANQYENVGNYKKAAHYHRLHNDEKDIQNNLKYSTSIPNIEKKNELERKNNELQVAYLKNKLSEELSKQKTTRIIFMYSIIIAIIVALIIAVILALRLQKSKQHIELQNVALERLNNLHQKVFTVVSHDFKGPIISLETLINTTNTAIYNPEQFIANSNNIRASLQQANLIMENLLNWSKNELGLANNSSIKTNIYATFNAVQEQMQMQLTLKKCKVENTIPTQLVSNIPADILKIVFRNLLSNAIKYSFDDEKIIIGFDVTHNALYVQDYGIGMVAERAQKLFTNQIDSKLGTNNENGYGISLNFVYELLHKHNSKIWVQSSVDEGTTVFFNA